MFSDFICSLFLCACPSETMGWFFALQGTCACVYFMVLYAFMIFSEQALIFCVCGVSYRYLIPKNNAFLQSKVSLVVINLSLLSLVCLYHSLVLIAIMSFLKLICCLNLVILMALIACGNHSSGL